MRSGGSEGEARLVFLLYYSRSGSTFLSSRLDRFEDIGVSLESGLFRTLILKKADLLKARDPETVYDLVSGEGRFGNLGVSREAFAERLRPGGGYGVEEVARAALGAHLGGREPEARVWVVKDGANGYWVNQISSEIPDALFVHVLRDGRAVLNSGLNNARPYAAGERMARDPATAARTWTSFVRSVDGYAARHSGRVLECRYEDLMADEEGEISRVRRFLGLPAETVAGEADDYYERLPEKERRIHRLISGVPEKGRVEAWREELGRGERLVFEHRAAPVLREHGYDVPEAGRFSELLTDRDFVAAYGRSAALRARDWLRLVSDTDKLRRIVEARLLQRRDRRA